jgi:hypothetical protein
MQTCYIPEDVKNTPVGPDGNGFIVLGILASSIVGSDGECYERKNGVISIAPDES